MDIFSLVWFFYQAIFYSIRKKKLFIVIMIEWRLTTYYVLSWLEVALQYLCVCVWCVLINFKRLRLPLVLNHSWGMLSVKSLAKKKKRKKKSLANLCMLSGKNLWETSFCFHKTFTLVLQVYTLLHFTSFF